MNSLTDIDATSTPAPEWRRSLRAAREAREEEPVTPTSDLDAWRAGSPPFARTRASFPLTL